MSEERERWKTSGIMTIITIMTKMRIGVENDDLLRNKRETIRDTKIMLPKKRLVPGIKRRGRDHNE